MITSTLLHFLCEVCERHRSEVCHAGGHSQTAGEEAESDEEKVGHGRKEAGLHWPPHLLDTVLYSRRAVCNTATA